MHSGTMGSDGVEFRHFDSMPVVANDHFYINSKASSNTKNAKIMREWKILEHNLPDSIYVQVYETRIDLLRVVIIGSAGTPYQDGLFFFDIFLPSGYPNQPPKVCYRSHGYRLNPNLYANGLVCLSLINTWSGKKAEKWSNQSTILQLLVSIQGLVLNARPYFNEPMFAQQRTSKHPKWINLSNVYNEDVFILSCLSILKILQRPPQNFEKFVVEHFRQRAASLIEAIDRYHQGHVPVGELGMDSAFSSSQVCVSEKFVNYMANLRHSLESAFSPFVAIPRRIRDPTTLKNTKKLHEKCPTTLKATKEQHEKGLVKRIICFVKKIWTSNK